MEVIEVSALVRYSKDIGGSWKSLELGAKAQVSIMDNWDEAQAELYQQLSHQLRQLWSGTNCTATSGPETAIAGSNKPEAMAPNGAIPVWREEGH